MDMAKVEAVLREYHALFQEVDRKLDVMERLWREVAGTLDQYLALQGLRTSPHLDFCATLRDTIRIQLKQL